MKYQFENIGITNNIRKQVNITVLEAIRSGESTLSKKEIYQAYTGLGGLHGLSRSEFECYHDYAEAKKDIEQGQFFTPHSLCENVVNIIKPLDTDLICDLTCGSGNFFNHLPIEKNVFGCEIDSDAADVAKFLYPKANIVNEDIRYYSPDVYFDLIIGNPPFNLKWFADGQYFKSQAFFVKKAKELLKPAGLLAMIVPESFLSDEFMEKSMIEMVNENFSFVAQVKIDKNAFSDTGVFGFKTKLVILQRSSEHFDSIPFKVGCFQEDNQTNLYLDFIKPLQDEKKRIAHRILAEFIASKSQGNNFAFSKSNQSQSHGFSFVVKKYLFEIKSHKITKVKYQDALNFIDKYRTQKQPDDMSEKEWERSKITKGKVIAYLKRIVKLQNQKPQKDAICLVKTSYGVKLKAYSPKAKTRLNKHFPAHKQFFPFYDYCLNQNFQLPQTKHNGNIEKVIDRKVKDYNTQLQNFNDMKQNPGIKKYLDSFTFMDQKAGKCHLRPIQNEDLNIVLQKRFGIIAWEMGGGKTAAGYCFAKYRMQNNFAHNAVIVSAAISIRMTWVSFLKLNNEDFIIIDSIRDIEKIKPGQFVLITCNKVGEITKHIKNWVKRKNQNIAFIFDESDEITNFYSKRTRSVLTVFRKVKHTLLTTGTTTRNNINELYAQLELLYNNSYNFINHCSTMFKEVKERGEDVQIKSFDNPRYLQPYQAWKGNRQFAYCFNPSKTTVFGISKQNQDVYNQSHLVSLIEKTIITRSLKDISGEQKYITEAVQVEQDDMEKDIYKTILDETRAMISMFYKSTGDARKDSFLVAVRQMRLLIESCSTPQKFGYPTTEAHAKMRKISDMVSGELRDKKVAIGCISIEALNLYVSHFIQEDPFRQLFVIKGSVSFNKRKKIIADFQASPNGILISTQDSLKSSVNIPLCKHVIIESLQWNLPRLKQYFFRFVRFNSVDLTKVYFVTYKNSIENNMLALLMAKESLNDFVKTREFRDKEEFMKDYEIDVSILDSIMQKEKDEEGRSYVTWGKQYVA